MNLGGPELLILVALAVLVFGAGWLPKAARNLGKAKVEFDQAQQQLVDTKQQVVEATGIQQLESTMRKANKALNTSPQNMLKNAAVSAVTTPTTPADPEATADEAPPTDDTNPGDAAETVADAPDDEPTPETINVNFNDEA